MRSRQREGPIFIRGELFLGRLQNGENDNLKKTRCLRAQLAPGFGREAKCSPGYWFLGVPRARLKRQYALAPKARLFFKNQVFFITQFLTFFCKLPKLGWAPAGEFSELFRRWPTAGF